MHDPHWNENKVGFLGTIISETNQADPPSGIAPLFSGPPACAANRAEREASADRSVGSGAQGDWISEEQCGSNELPELSHGGSALHVELDGVVGEGIQLSSEGEREVLGARSFGTEEGMPRRYCRFEERSCQKTTGCGSTFKIAPGV